MTDRGILEKIVKWDGCCGFRESCDGCPLEEWGENRANACDVKSEVLAEAKRRLAKLDNEWKPLEVDKCSEWPDDLFVGAYEFNYGDDCSDKEGNFELNPKSDIDRRTNIIKAYLGQPRNGYVRYRKRQPTVEDMAEEWYKDRWDERIQPNQLNLSVSQLRDALKESYIDGYKESEKRMPRLAE